MPIGKDLELARAAYIIVRDMIKVKPGESVLITVDSINDWRVAEETAKAAEALGGKVMVAWHSTPEGYGKLADPGLPDALKAAVSATDAWIEFNNQWLLYSSPWEVAMANGRTRNLFLGGLDTDRVVRCIGKINMVAQVAFQNKVVAMTKHAKKMRITNPAGTDISFENHPDRPVTNELTAETPGPHFLIGQIGWAPIEESINGVIVFDGSFSGGGEADLGVLAHPIRLVVEKGVIVDIQGQAEAKAVKNWLEKLGDSRMYNVAHVCYGFNPGSQLTGLCTEDERVWGSTEWGFGYQGPMFEGAFRDAASHADGICLNSSVWLDGELIMEEGKLVHPALSELAKACGK
ncbi:MAG: leucyl aminopeptidase [delta proteobacterium ML8_F1]|nr:MAG: leucyl aminopeptidase [delta proteobacterium ML8_F1]